MDLQAIDQAAERHVQKLRAQPIELGGSREDEFFDGSMKQAREMALQLIQLSETDREGALIVWQFLELHRPQPLQAPYSGHLSKWQRQRFQNGEKEI
jgi:hypothetical protein